MWILCCISCVYNINLKKLCQDAPCFLNTTVREIKSSGSSKSSPNDRDWSLWLCGFPLSALSSKSKQSFKSYTLSAAFCKICCFCAGVEKPSSTVCRPVHREPTVAVLVKSKVPLYVPADLLRKWKILPCCPALGWKIARLKHPAIDEVVIENCWCWQQWSRFRTRKICSGHTEND